MSYADTPLFMVQSNVMMPEECAEIFAKTWWSNPREVLPMDCQGQFALVKGVGTYAVKKKTVNGRKFLAVVRVLE